MTSNNSQWPQISEASIRENWYDLNDKGEWQQAAKTAAPRTSGQTNSLLEAVDKRISQLATQQSAHIDNETTAHIKNLEVLQTHLQEKLDKYYEKSEQGTLTGWIWKGVHAIANAWITFKFNKRIKQLQTLLSSCDRQVQQVHQVVVASTVAASTVVASTVVASTTKPPEEPVRVIPNNAQELTAALQSQDIKKIGNLLAQIEFSTIPPEQVSQLKKLLKKALNEDGATFCAIIERIPTSLMAFLKTEQLSQDDVSKIKETLKTASEPLTSAISKRLEQIEGVFEDKLIETNKGIEPLDILKMATFVEVDIIKLNQIASGVLKRKDTGLARTLQFDATTREVYVLASREFSKINAEGTFKKVVSCARLAFSNYSEKKAFARVFTKPNLKSSNLAEVLQEVNYAKQFSGQTGFFRMHTVSNYTFTYKNNETPRVSMIFDLASGDLEKLTDREQSSKLRAREMLQVAKDITSSLAFMHQNGIIHGDFKPANAMFSRAENTGAISAGITDFGFTHKPTPGKPDTDSTAGLYNVGYYGSPAYTAPELLATQNFEGDHFKVEAFALGTTLYELRFQKDAPWGDIAGTAYDACCDKKNNKPKTDRGAKRRVRDFQNQMVDCLNKKILEKLKKLEGKINRQQELTPQERYDFVMYKLLDPNPQKRISIIEARELLANQ